MLKKIKNCFSPMIIRRIFIATITLILTFQSIFASSKLSVQDSLLIVKYFTEGQDAGRRGEYIEAIKYFNQVYLLREKAFGKSSYKMGSPLINLGIQYKSLGDIDKAIELYKKAEEIYIKEVGSEYPDLGTIYINLGVIYELRGDFIKALDYQNNAYRILKKDSASVRYNQNFQDAKYNIANAKLKLGYYKEAIKYAQANLGSTLPRLKPRIYDLIATAYQKEGNYSAAEKNYLKSIQSWIDLRGEADVELISEYLAYSSFLTGIEKYEKALLYSTKAKDIVLRYFNKKSVSYSQVESNFGDYYFSKNLKTHQMEDFRKQRKKYLLEAIQYYQNAIVALVDSFDDKNPFRNPELKDVISDIELIEVLKKKAVAMEKVADIFISEFDHDGFYKYSVASLEALSKSVELIHKLQVGFESEESRLFLSQNQANIFSEAIRIAYKLYNQTHKKEFLEIAFEYSERSKSSNLLVSVKDSKAKEIGGIPDTLIEKESFLKSSIANYTLLLSKETHEKEPDSQKIDIYTGKIFKYNEEYGKMIESFEKNYPQYYSLKYENKVVEIKEIQDRLSSKEAVVEYFLNEPNDEKSTGELYRFVVTKDSVNFTKENIDIAFGNQIQQVHDFLVNPNFLNTKKRDFVNYSVAAYYIYEKLLQPVRSRLSGKILTIIPHGKLSYLPFDALISQKPDTSVMNFKKLHYLVNDFVVNYSYSATLSNKYFSNHKAAPENLIVFAPLYNPNEDRADAQTAINYRFSPLNGAKDEVKGITRFVHGDTFVDDLAQENLFKEKAADYDILHLAMHTVINDSLPMFSKLIFSDPKANSGDDGNLNTFEIYNMKFKARLAVLSACETGTGKLQKGEGVMSMARGFIYAGCPSIVMTLWQLEDKSGVQIMRDFYLYLSKGKRKDVALRMAKLNHLKNADALTAHPHFWLGYVSIGNPEPLYTSKDVYFVIFLFAVILIVFADWYIRKKPRRMRGLK